MTTTTVAAGGQPKLPRVAITFCTQCRWMLRAAYFGQELLSTFGTTIGEIALIPATGGIFTVELTYQPKATEDENAVEISQELEATSVLVWDRKSQGGFPETKVLKQLIRDHLDPKRDLGHSDKHGKKAVNVESSEKLEKLEKKSDEETQTVVTSLTDKVAEMTLKARDSPEKRNPDGTICEDCQ